MGNLEKNQYVTLNGIRGEREKVYRTEKFLSNDNIKRKTREEIEELEFQLTSGNLNKIGVSRSEALRFVQKGLGIKKPFDINNFKLKIEDFQEEHKIGVDGRIGKETYVQLVLVQASKNIEMPNIGLSQDSMDRMMVILKNGEKTDKDVIKVMAFLRQFKMDKKGLIEKDEKHQDFFGKVDKIILDFKNSPEGKKVLKTSKKSFDSIYGIIKKIGSDEISMKDGVEKIVKDPTLLLAGGILFLFGVIGGDTKYTNSFMKRVGWIFGGMFFGPAIWKKLGVGEMIDDATEGISNTKEYLTKYLSSEENARKKEEISKFFSSIPDKIRGIKIGSVDFSKIKDDVLKVVDTVSSKTFSYNESLEGKDGYINPGVLAKLDSVLFADEKFLNTARNDLRDVSGVSSLNNYLTETGKEKIGKLKSEGIKIGEKVVKLSDKDISNFIHKHLDEQFSGDDHFVRDIFFTSEILDRIRSFVSRKKYFEDNRLNSEIRTDLSDFLNSSDEKKKNAGEALRQAILSNDLVSFDVSHYGLSLEDAKKLENIKQKVESFISAQKFVDDKNKEVERIVLKPKTENSEETQKTLGEKLDNLEKIKSEFDKGWKTKDQSVSRGAFDLAYANKKSEIFKMAKLLEITSLTIGGETINVGEKIEALRVEKDIQRDLEKINSIKNSKISEVPNSEKSLQDFLSYLEKHSESFSKALELKGKYEGVKDGDEIVEEAGKVLEYKGIFEVNLKTKIDNIKGEFAKFKEEKLDKIIIKDSYNDQEFLITLEKLSKVGVSYNKLKAKLMGSLDETNFQTSMLRLVGNLDLPNTKDIESELKTKLSNLKRNFSLEVEIPKNLDNEADYDSLSKAINNIKLKENIISGFNEGNISISLGAKSFNFSFDLFGTDEIGDEKLSKLENVKKEIVNLFKTKIKTVGELSEIEDIIGKFDTYVVKEGIAKGNSLNDVIEKRTFELFEGELRNVRNVEGLKGIKEKYGVSETMLKIFDKIPGVDVKSDRYYKAFVDRVKRVITFNYFNGKVGLEIYDDFMEKNGNAKTENGGHISQILSLDLANFIIQLGKVKITDKEPKKSRDKLLNELNQKLKEFINNL